MCADVAGWLDALALGRVDLIGHSMGGAVALLLAEQFPGAQLATIPAGHLIHRAEPGLFIQAVLAFLG